MSNPARTGHQNVDGVTIFVTRDEEPYSWCAEYELGGSLRNDTWRPRKLRTCVRTYDKLIARVREDIREHRSMLASTGTYGNPLPSYMKGLGVVLAGTFIGAVIGAATNPPCNDTFQILCGPRVGAELGGIGALGLTALGAAGVAVATKNETAKNASIIGAVAFATLYLAGRIIGATAATTPVPASNTSAVPTAPVAA